MNNFSCEKSEKIVAILAGLEYALGMKLKTESSIHAVRGLANTAAIHLRLAKREKNDQAVIFAFRASARAYIASAKYVARCEVCFGTINLYA